MNIHIPPEIREKYPNMEFRGVRRVLKNRTVIDAVNHSTGMNFYYSFEEDFFWMRNMEMPDWMITK